MKTQNTLNAIFILLLALAIGLACSGSSSPTQFNEANKVVDKANKQLDDAKSLYAKTEKRDTELFSVNLRTPAQLLEYKAKMRDEAKSIVSDYEKVSSMLKDISKQYDDISKMNVGDKYKDYAKLKSDEYAKRADAIDIRKGNAQAFMDIDDPRTMTTKFDENNTKSDRYFKDAEDMGSRAKKIEEENKDIFKET